MIQNNLTNLSNEELLLEGKKIKSTKIFDAFAFGILIGIAVYSTFRNGLGLLTFLPLIYLPIAKRNNNKIKELEQLLKDKNLK